MKEKNVQISISIIVWGQKFYNNLVIYLLYSLSHNKSRLVFRVKTIMLHYLKLFFCQFCDPVMIPVLILQGKKPFHYSFHLILVGQALRV